MSGQADDRKAQDEALARRHEEREAISRTERKRLYESEEVALTAWEFPTQGWRLQVTAKGEAKQQSGDGYIVLTIVGAAQLWRDLGQSLREKGVIR